MLQANNLCVRYGDTEVLKNLSFKVPPGDILCLLGNKGAGKTTTINIFSGEIEPSSGEALVGKVSAGHELVKNSIAFIPEKVKFYGHLSALENLDIFSRLAGFIYTQEGLRGLLRIANLHEDSSKKRLVTYSKGMRLKLCLALALAQKATYILMDEPTLGLNFNESEEFLEMCKALSANGIGILLATDNFSNAVNISTKIVIMSKGTIIQTLETQKTNLQELQNLYANRSNLE